MKITSHRVFDRRGRPRKWRRVVEPGDVGERLIMEPFTPRTLKQEKKRKRRSAELNVSLGGKYQPNLMGYTYRHYHRTGRLSNSTLADPETAKQLQKFHHKKIDSDPHPDWTIDNPMPPKIMPPKIQISYVDSKGNPVEVKPEWFADYVGPRKFKDSMWMLEAGIDAKNPVHPRGLSKDFRPGNEGGYFYPYGYHHKPFRLKDRSLTKGGRYPKPQDFWHHDDPSYYGEDEIKYNDQTSIDEYLDLCMADANVAAGDPEFLRVYDDRAFMPGNRHSFMKAKISGGGMGGGSSSGFGNENDEFGGQSESGGETNGNKNRFRSATSQKHAARKKSQWQGSGKRSMNQGAFKEATLRGNDSFSAIVSKPRFSARRSPFETNRRRPYPF